MTGWSWSDKSSRQAGCTAALRLKNNTHTLTGREFCSCIISKVHTHTHAHTTGNMQLQTITTCVLGSQLGEHDSPRSSSSCSANLTFSNLACRRSSCLSLLHVNTSHRPHLCNPPLHPVFSSLTLFHSSTSFSPVLRLGGEPASLTEGGERPSQLKLVRHNSSQWCSPTKVSHGLCPFSERLCFIYLSIF